MPILLAVGVSSMVDGAFETIGHKGLLIVFQVE